MVHLSALPGTPLYDEDGGLDGIVKNARKDLIALQNAGVDAVMFGNENDRPYEFDVDTASTCLLYTSPSPRDLSTSRMPSSA